MKRLTVLFAFVAALFVLSAAGLAQPHNPPPPRPDKKPVPLEQLQQISRQLAEIEAALSAPKLARKERERLVLQMRQLRTELDNLILDVQDNKVILPAYDCCPCATHKDDQGGTVQVNVVVQGGPTPPPDQPPPPPEPARVAMDPGRFEKLKVAIRDQGFPDDKLSVLKTAIGENWFTVAQVKAILEEFTFPDDKLDALRALVGHILDTDNLFEIYSSFVHSSDKEEAKKILEGK
jgi:hypothetical protein